VSDSAEFLRKIPSVDQLLKNAKFDRLSEQYSRAIVVQELRGVLEGLRKEISCNSMGLDLLKQKIGCLLETVAFQLNKRLQPSLGRVINATGVLLHTNIGRAPVSCQMGSQGMEISSSYTNLEYDLTAGKRGYRDQHVEPRLKRMLDCEAALVCNNNAAAIHLILNTFARDRTVLVSRGELVEIGGSFRIPNIMEASGGLLKEVGTTNKTRISDFESSIDAQTGLILRVHPSNYRIMGFTEAPSLSQLSLLAQRYEVPFLHDLGSGLLFPSSHPALLKEPSVEESLSAGVDLVCFSGDKLLGGPQAGIIVGREKLVVQLRRNPIMRAVRVDKITYALLDRTLLEFESERARQSVPIQKMLYTTKQEIEKRARSLCEQLTLKSLSTALIDGHSLVGGGAAPEQRIPTRLIALESSTQSTNQLEANLRGSNPSILTRIESGRVLLDLRTVLPEQEDIISKALNALA
jgi:L-seryl-tRNA(Ser) seleniumtransferase